MGSLYVFLSLTMRVSSCHCSQGAGKSHCHNFIDQFHTSKSIKERFVRRVGLMLEDRQSVELLNVAMLHKAFSQLSQHYGRFGLLARQRTSRSSLVGHDAWPTSKSVQATL